MTNSRDRMMKAAIPLIFLIGEEEQELTDTPVNLSWDLEYYGTAEFSVSGDQITINRDCGGLFEVTISVGCEADDGDPWHIGLGMYVNGSGNWIPRDQNLAYAPFDAGGESGTCVLHEVVYLNAGDVITIKAWVDDGTSYTNQCRMLIKGIAMEGWNNAHGGAIFKKETISL
jgi:hypothetical protein